MSLEYLIRRIFLLLVIIWCAATLNFFVPRMTGGDPVRSQLMQQAVSGGGVQAGMDEMVAEYQERFGLNDPLLEQYFAYLRQVATLDLGYSMTSYPATVWEVMSSAIPWTVGLLFTTTILAFILGTLAGALLGWRKSPRFIHYIFPPLLTFSAIPFFLLGLMLLYIFAFQVRWLPLFGGYTPGTFPGWNLAFAEDVLRHSILPAVAILLASMGFWALGMRGMMITADGEDYMIFAEASGLKNRTLFFSYAMRNAMLPQTTALALTLGQLLTGALLVEVIFNYPGIGGVLYYAIRQFDYFVIQGVILIIVIGVALATLILDLIYPLLDPRIKYQRG
jgi:peptide/nickel transport system permease protein